MCLNPDMSLIPGVAESYTFSHNVYTFCLREAKWSDGSSLTAYDFERTWKGILDPAFASPDAYLLYCIKNARAAKRGQVALDRVGIFAKDEKTFVVELEAPIPYFLQIAASSVLLPTGSDSLSNGPFRLKQWKKNEQLILEKNPYYHRTHAVALEHVFIDIIDTETALQGQYDVIGYPLSSFPTNCIEDLKDRLHFFSVAGSKFLAFNTSKPPLNNTQLRRALSQAIVREDLVKQLAKSDRKALSLLPPVLGSVYFPADFNVHKEMQAIGPLELMYAASEANHSLAQALRQMWSKTLGLDITLKAVDFQTLHTSAAQGSFSIGLFAWLADYLDPMSILDRFTDKTNHRNYCKWENERYSQCIKAGLIQEAQEILWQEMPFACLFHENFAFLLSSRVRHFAVSPLGHIYFDRIVLTEDR